MVMLSLLSANQWQKLSSQKTLGKVVIFTAVSNVLFSLPTTVLYIL